MAITKELGIRGGFILSYIPSRSISLLLEGYPYAGYVEIGGFCHSVSPTLSVHYPFMERSPSLPRKRPSIDFIFMQVKKRNAHFLPDSMQPCVPRHFSLLITFPPDTPVCLGRGCPALRETRC